jgi:PE family
VAPIVVDPEVLAGAAVSISGVGDLIAAALSTLASALPNGAIAGHDAAGLAFGQAYKQAGQALLNAAAAAVNGGRKVGFGVQMSATNYSRADASSTIGGIDTVLSPPAPPGKFDAPSISSPFGGGVAQPFLWSMVEMLVGGVWPDGDPAQLRAAAGAWSSFASTLAGIGGELAGPSAAVSGQQIPEGPAMGVALSDLKQGLSDITTESVKLAAQTFEFAADVEAAQNTRYGTC